jgi:hypothetical protein
MTYHIRVHVTQTGSRDVAIHDIDQYDFVFPSVNRRPTSSSTSAPTRCRRATPRSTGRSPARSSWRPTASTRHPADNGIAIPQAGDGEGPLYYRLDLRAFLALVGDPTKTWNSIGIGKHGVSNGNGVLAHSPNICSSNSSGTYMGLVAFVQNGNQVPHGPSPTRSDWPTRSSRW